MIKYADVDRLRDIQNQEIAKLEFPELAIAVRRAYKQSKGNPDHLHTNLVVEAGLAVYSISLRLGYTSQQRTETVVLVCGAMLEELRGMGIYLQADEPPNSLLRTILDLVDNLARTKFDPYETYRMN